MNRDRQMDSYTKNFLYANKRFISLKSSQIVKIHVNEHLNFAIIIRTGLKNQDKEDKDADYNAWFLRGTLLKLTLW